MVQKTSARGCNPKKKCKLWDVRSTNELTLSHDIVKRILSDKWKWLELFGPSAQAYVTCVTNGNGRMKWHNKLSHLPYMVSFLSDRISNFIKITLTHFAYSTLGIYATFFHVRFTHFIAHNFFICTFASEISKEHDFVQVLARFSTQIDMTHWHSHGTFTFLCSAHNMWRWILINTLVCIPYLCSHLHDTLSCLWANGHTHMHVASTHAFVHAHLYYTLHTHIVHL